MNKVHEEIEKRFIKRKRGYLFLLSDFRGLGTEAAIKMALSRLSKQGKVKRLAKGVYVVPKVDSVIGKILPSMEEIAEFIARKSKVKIKPAGAFALHKLGLTTQVPTRLVYITDGAARQIRIGKAIIKFKPTTPKKLSLEGKLSSLIIQALEELGIDQIDADTTMRIRELLKQEKEDKLIRDMKLAPAKISDFLYKLLKEEKND